MNIKIMNRNGAEVYIPFDVVRYFFPRIGEAVAGYVIWNMTAYPFNGPEGMRDQLEALAASVRPRKRGWLRRLSREARRIDAEMWESGDDPSTR